MTCLRCEQDPCVCREPSTRSSVVCQATHHGERVCDETVVGRSRFCPRHQFCGVEATVLPPWLAGWLQREGVDLAAATMSPTQREAMLAAERADRQTATITRRGRQTHDRGGI